MEEFTQWLIDSWYFLLNQDKGYFIFSHSEEIRKEIDCEEDIGSLSSRFDVVSEYDKWS